MSSPRTGVKSPAANGVLPVGTPSRAHPRVGVNLMRQIQRHSGWVYSVALSPDASLIASCSNDRTVRIFPAASVLADRDSSGGLVMKGHSNAIRCCAFNASSSLLSTASWDGDVRIWDVVSGACVRTISPAAGGNRVYACAWAVPAADGSEVLAAAGGGGSASPVDFSVRMWKFMSNQDATCRVFEGHSKAVTSLAFASDGMSLLSSSDDHTVRVWDVTCGSASLVMSHDNAVCCCCWGPAVTDSSSPSLGCSRTIASGDQDSFIIVWNADTGKPLSRISSCQSSVFSLMYISFGTILASGGRDGSIKMWDAISGVGLAEVKEAHSDSVRGMACDSSGRLLVTASADMSVKIWQQCDIPPPLPPRSSAALLRLKTVTLDDEPSDHDSESESVSALAANTNHGLFTAHSKRSLAFALETPTDAEDEAELSPHAAVDSADVAPSGSLGMLSPINGSPLATSSCLSNRKSTNGLSARHRSIASDSNSKKQSPRRFSRSNSRQLASEPSGVSFDSSFVDSPTGPAGAAEANADSAASSAVKTAAACLTDSSPQSSTSSSDNHRVCIECGENWSLESKERHYFTTKGLHTPRRCGKCRSLNKLELMSLAVKDTGDARTVSGVLPSVGSVSGTGVEVQNASASGMQQHAVYRGTNLLGIGFVYEGGVNASGRQEGFGTQTWDTNHTYKGEWRGGRKEGRGVYTWPDGATYEGEYRRGRRHGCGLQTMNDGAVYDGSFKNGEWDGLGRHTWPDKFILRNGQVVRGYMQYTGEYRAGLMHGRGQMCWPDGSVYDGEWSEGAKHGRGELMFPNSRRQHGIWEQDVLVQVLMHVVNGKVVPVVTPISPIKK